MKRSFRESKSLLTRPIFRELSVERIAVRLNQLDDRIPNLGRIC